MKLPSLVRLPGAARLAVYLLALWKLFKHPHTPRAAKWVAVAVLAYALSPIDLIPDFIPVLGQLDDLVLVPLGIWWVLRLTPAPLWRTVLAEAEAAAQTSGDKLPRLRWGVLLVLAAWALLLGSVLWWWVKR